MYNDIYGKISTPLQFMQGFAYKHYDEKKPRRHKRRLITETDKIAYVKNEYERRRMERLYFELRWQLNMAFIEGEQYQYICNITNDLVEYPKLLKAQEREAYNHILPIWLTRLAKLSRLNQTYKARPSSQDADDVNNAYITTKILDSWANSNELNKAQSTANAWAETTGTAIWKNIWNPNEGMKLGLTMDNEGRPVYQREGEPVNVVCSPFEIFPDSSYNSDIEYCKSIIHARAVDVDYIYDTFGVDLQGTKLNIFGRNALFNLNNSKMGVDSKQKDEVIMLYEYYEIPSKEFPDGKLIICCDYHDKLLYEGDLPYINSKYNNRALPFVLQRSIIRPGYFWGKTIIDSLIPVQRRYNAIKNRISEYMKSAAIGVVIVDAATAESNNLDSEGIAPGDILIYNKSDGTQVPTYMQSQGMPAEFFNQEQTDLVNFTKISGVSELSRDSTVPTGVESGRALNILNEQDETRLHLTAVSIQDSMLEVARQTLYLYKQFAENERILRVVGQVNSVKTIYWNKNTITADDIIIEGVARISESLSQRRNLVINLLQYGMFRDERGAIDDSKILEMLEFGDTNVGMDSKRIEKTKSNEQNIKMSMGQPQPVEFFELHDVAVETHREFMLSSEFEVLPPEIQEIFKMHIAEHMKYIQQAMMQQQMQMQPKPQGKPIDLEKRQENGGI